MPNGNDTHQQGFASATGNNMQQQHGLDPLGAPGHQQHGGFSQQQSQGCDEQGSQGSAQQDALTQQLHQVLIADMGRFWTTTVAPSTQAIAQCTMTLQKDAADLNSRADAELQTVINELTRVHGLVASFQDQIRETLSMLQG